MVTVMAVARHQILEHLILSVLTRIYALASHDYSVRLHNLSSIQPALSHNRLPSFILSVPA